MYLQLQHRRQLTSSPGTSLLQEHHRYWLDYTSEEVQLVLLSLLKKYYIILFLCGVPTCTINLTTINMLHFCQTKGSWSLTCWGFRDTWPWGQFLGQFLPMHHSMTELISNHLGTKEQFTVRTNSQIHQAFTVTYLVGKAKDEQNFKSL